MDKGMKVQIRSCEYLNGSFDWIWTDFNVALKFNNEEEARNFMQTNRPHDIEDEDYRIVGVDTPEMKHYLDNSGLQKG